MTANTNQADNGLRRFQQQTVERAWTSLYNGEGTGRFLVADEVGLGKTRVAAALIRRVEARLAPRASGTVVYFAPNADVAHQNLRILRPHARQSEPRQRLTLLPLFEPELRKPGIHVLGFTPATSLAVSRGTGTAQERALLVTLLRAIWNIHATQPVLEVFRVRAGLEGFRERVQNIDSSVAYGAIARRFQQELRKHPDCQASFVELRDVARAGELAFSNPRGSGPAARKARSDNAKRRELIGQLRLLLARACLKGLKAQLVILDEFHRYPEVLRNAEDAATLEHALLDGSPTLLLSATPYRMSADELDSDTHVELSQLLGFLLGADAASDAEHELGELRSSLRRLRPVDDLEHSESVERARAAKIKVESRLAAVMSRWQRPNVDGQTETRTLMPTRDDVAAYLGFQRAVDIAAQTSKLHHRQTVEYWKSAPYLMSFMRGYRVSSALDEAREHGPSLRAINRVLRASVGTVLRLGDIEAYRPLPIGHPRFRELERLSLSADQWRSLWVPPSLPPYAPTGHFSRAAEHAATKTLVFSAWRVVPTAVAALAGYEAERRSGVGQKNTPDARKRRNASQLLSLRQPRAARRQPRAARQSATAAQGMSVLTLVYPSLALAELVDPYELSRQRGTLPSNREVLHRSRLAVRRAIRSLHGLERKPGIDPRWYWAAPLLLDAEGEVDVEELLRGREGLGSVWRQQGEEASHSGAVESALSLARRVVAGATPLGKMPRDLDDVLARMATAGPAVCALRTLRAKGYEEGGQLVAAQIGWGMRTLLNRADATLVIRGGRRPKRTPGADAYWRQALDYCVDGALQGVLDEYLHLLLEEHSRPGLDAAALLRKTAEAFCATTDLQPLAIRADQPTTTAGLASVKSRRLTSRFAVAFGATQTENEDAIHPEIVRQAFNSPFWPWVLVTTSVGQEGLDFHRYCHQIVHWNVPATPVELEQREGRVIRYFNHAVRRNLAQRHRPEALAEPDRWSAMLVAAHAEVERANANHDGFAPEWHYRGDHTVGRIAPILAYSRDYERFLRVRRARIYYRLVLGQPNPQELVEAVMAAIPVETAERLLRDGLALDLRPKLND